MSDEPDGVPEIDPADVPGAADDLVDRSGTEPADSVNPTGSVEPAVSGGAASDSDEPAAPLQGRPRLAKGPVADDAADSTVADVADSDVANSDGDREAAVVGASAAGSARAAARRSGARTATTASKGTATRPRDLDREVRIGLFARLVRFLREVVAELRKVIWPARNQMVTYTLVVIVFVVIMIALVAGLDVLFAKGVLWIFG